MQLEVGKLYTQTGFASLYWDARPTDWLAPVDQNDVFLLTSIKEKYLPRDEIFILTLSFLWPNGTLHSITIYKDLASKYFKQV